MQTNSALDTASLEARIASLEEELDRCRSLLSSDDRGELKYRRLIEASPYCIKHIGTDGRLLSMNQAGLSMINEQCEEDIIGRHYLQVVSPEDVPRVDAHLRRALAGESPEFEFKTSFGRIFRSNFAPIFGANGEVTSLLSITHDVTARIAAEAALRVGEERFRLVSHATRDPVFDWDITANKVWRNGVYQEMFGAPEFASSRDDWWESRLHPDDRERVTSDQRRALLKGDRWIAEYRLRTPSGEYRSMLARTLVMRDETGRAIRIVGSLADLTEQRLAEERQRMMVNELDHRVKNNLTVVLALAEQSRKRAASLDEFMETFAGRLRALAGSHDALAAAHWEGVALQAILNAALAPHASAESDRVRITGQLPIMPPRVAGPLTLAVHELATNALKHGALSTSNGRIDISVEVIGGTIRFDWLEAGVAVPAQPNPGTGLSLIRGLIEHELCGEMEISFSPSGVHCRLGLPLQPRRSESVADGERA